jgi:diguanylate cyclase (GGDEF)-like protein
VKEDTFCPPSIRSARDVFLNLTATPRPPEPPLSLEQEELRGIARTVAEIHWLLLILVLLYLVFGGVRDDTEAHAAVAAGLIPYAALVMALRYAGIYRRETRWKIAIETWAMIALVTWVLAHTGGLASPLLSAYLLPVVTAALTLGRLATFAEVGLIAACHVYLGGDASAEKLLSLPFAGELAAQLAPVLLVAYVTTMFSADIRHGLGRAKLLSETDHLTGMYNPRGFAIVANRAFAQTARHARPTSVLMIDCDNLKPVNDRHGHELGSELLRRLAEVILGELRYTDVAARYGGDEFVVLLAETPVRGALGVAERIRASAEAGLASIDGVRTNSTVSIGLAAFPEDGVALDDLVACADRALYKAKELGRNRVARLEPEAAATVAAPAEPPPAEASAASPPRA